MPCFVKDWFKIIFVLFFSLLLSGPAAADVTLQDSSQPRPAIMRPDAATLKKWMEQYETAPVFQPTIDSSISKTRASQDLLSHLQYTPSERNQGSCGNCWVWAGTGALAIAMDIQESVKDRLSIQYVSACNGSKTCCDGGTAQDIAAFYQSAGRALPWSNTNAEWRNGDGICKNDCATIGTTPQYDIQSITAQRIVTNGVDQDEAITNIKAALDSGKAVHFSFYLATESDWNGFYTFWYTGGATTAFDYSSYADHTAGDGFGGHAVLIVGYEDDGTDRYWIALNSWGTASGTRSDGTFRIAMETDYQATFNYDGYPYPLLTFYAFNVQFGDDASCPTSLSPTSNSFTASAGTESITVSAGATCSWLATEIFPWITIDSGESGMGTGTINYTVAANTSNAARTGYIMVEGQKYTIAQAGAPSSCTFSLDPSLNEFDGLGGYGTVGVNASGTTCDWTASSNSASWLSIFTGMEGSGSTGVYYTVQPNTGSNLRSGTLTIGGQTHTVNQETTQALSLVSSSSTFNDQQINLQAQVANTGTIAINSAQVWSVATETNFPCTGALNGSPLAQVATGSIAAGGNTSVSQTGAMQTILDGDYYVINLLVMGNYYTGCYNQGIHTFTGATNSSSTGGGCFLKSITDKQPRR